VHRKSFKILKQAQHNGKMRKGFAEAPDQTLWEKEENERFSWAETMIIQSLLSPILSKIFY